MSDLEGDISALQAGRIDPVPTYIEQDAEAEAGEISNLPSYVEHEEGQDELQAILAVLSAATPTPLKQVDPSIVKEIIRRRKGLVGTSNGTSKGRGSELLDVRTFYRMPDDKTFAEAVIVKTFFEAISRGETAVVKLFIENFLVTANTRQAGKTPLLAAVESRNIEMVKQLIQAGAEPDAYGVEKTAINRTPLQLAAAIGHLPLVKLFLETYHCDDSLIAPDGQIALRLAAVNGHREVVAYLPTRRGGGFLRWKTTHKVAINRSKRALMNIYKAIKILSWDVPKCLLWSVPKECIVKPISNCCSWCYKNRKQFGPWCKRKIQEIPSRIAKFGKWLWSGMTTIPKAVAKHLYKFITEELPHLLKDIGVYLWGLLTRRIPQAIAIVAKWIVDGVSEGAKLLWTVLLKTVSLLHTALAAIVSFFRSLTLKDIWNGFVDLLHAIFVSLPQKLWAWLCAAVRMSHTVLKTLFGVFGSILWYIGYGILWLVTYIPRKLWEVVKSMAGSLGKAFYEFAVWVNPKA